MTQLVALCAIYQTPKSGPLSEMSGYDNDGNPIVRATRVTIVPGEFFVETDASEAAWLVANDAARSPTPHEIEMHERVAGAR